VKALNTEKLHHAYLLQSSKEAGESFVREFIAKDLQLEIAGNPDIHFSHFETFGIDDARALKEQGCKKPLGERQIFSVSFSFITIEAQNALLKLFEEPGEDTHFFLITTANLLPTINSRVAILHLEERDDIALAKEFLSLGIDDRMKLVDERYKYTDSENKKSELLSLLNQIEKVFASKLGKDTAAVKALDELLELKKYLFDRAPSVKMIAEYLALRLPHI
jgi:DNA polymerase III gamma/tau subunit